MHNALLILEVRSKVLDYLMTNTGTRDPTRTSTTQNDTQEAGRRALAALARTCRTLSEPALDALWYELHSLEPLLQCSRTKDLDEDNSLPPFSEEEWKIVLRYAPRVRELTVLGSDSDEFSIQILQSLWFRTTLLLPNLRRLHWDRDDLTDFPLIRSLLCPSLRHLDVCLASGYDDRDQSSLFGFLECYHMFCPNLKSLHLRVSAHASGFQNSSSLAVTVISRAICRVPTLESLTCPALSAEAFLHLAKSHYLKKLSTRLVGHRTDDIRRLVGYSTPDSLLFENLRILHLRVHKFSTVTLYLKSCRQPLEDIFIEFFNDPSPEVFHRFFTALNSPTRRHSLRRIRLQNRYLAMGHRVRPAWKTAPMPSRTADAPSSGDSDDNDDDDTSPVHFEVLSPLLGFSLHTFEVQLKNPIPLSDDELARLVQGWPELETFRVTTRKEPPYSPTLRGLLLLLARCQKLCSLKLGVDARTIPSLTEDESKMRNMFIKELDTTHSLIEKPVVKGVARFLLEHFPSLTSVTGWLHSSPWSKVDAEIRVARSLDKSWVERRNWVRSDSDSDSESE